ncbi:J domain-containing protein [Acuticoccus mangrovi]|uniref:DnaJ domain-containing protein n=1 Tax=Acuticoccus mangrovi TaxID=2796142 RepID=A0A934IR03_9HYPH|nr:DnaJ domain-containing protein [Acuticoccus mangrovi]MBJ3776034.1 DnaJ domain-containing protein [Acuticoccus mangrovi]
MDFSSKDYDRIRVSRRRGQGRGNGGAATHAPVMERTCAVPGCNRVAEYRAPKGRGKEGQFHWFCLEHVREYNKSYNYFEGMDDDDVIAYQRDAIIGHRPTKPIGVRGAHRAREAKAAWRGMVDDPFGFFGAEGAHHEPPPEPERRRPKGPERDAFEVMGLDHSASKEAIKSRYKTLVKRHHPDANQGDRSSEERLRSIINAYAVLRRAGYC